MIAMVSEITSDDVRVLNDDKDTRFVEIHIPDIVAEHYKSIFDKHENEYNGVEAMRNYVYAEWHKDTNYFVYCLDLDNDIYYVTNDFSCDYLNELIVHGLK